MILSFGLHTLEYGLDLVTYNEKNVTKVMGVTFKIRLQKKLASILRFLTCSFCACYELPYREGHVARKWGRPLAYSQRGTESSQQPHERAWKQTNLNQAHRRDWSPRWPWLQHFEKPWGTQMQQQILQSLLILSVLKISCKGNYVFSCPASFTHCISETHPCYFVSQ